MLRSCQKYLTLAGRRKLAVNIPRQKPQVGSKAIELPEMLTINAISRLPPQTWNQSPSKMISVSRGKGAYHLKALVCLTLFLGYMWHLTGLFLVLHKYSIQLGKKKKKKAYLYKKPNNRQLMSNAIFSICWGKKDHCRLSSRQRS